MGNLAVGRGFGTSIRSFAWALLLLALLGSQCRLLAQVPPVCPHVCDQKYALCIAASCDASGKCGKCDKSDGSCGYCYVFEGKSCSFDAACSSVKPSGSTVYSTYSERLSSDFGFKVLNCASATSSADCMDDKCTLTGKTATLTDKAGKKVEIPTAICQCKVSQKGGATLGGQCNPANCSAIWSVAQLVLFDGLPHCQ
jgi:hypothetical protein